MACLRSTQASRIAGAEFLLVALHQIIIERDGPSLGGGGAEAQAALAAAAAAQPEVSRRRGRRGRSSRRFGCRLLPLRLAVSPQTAQLGELADGCFSSGSFAMN